MGDIKEFEYEYNPIKELKGGVEAGKVVWSTKSLETAVDALGKGLQLKANPFCGNNTKLLKPDLVYKRTKEEIDDIVHCMEDIVYFGNQCTLMTPEGLKRVKMRDYQEDYLHHVQNNRFSIYLSCRQSGKSTTTGIFCLYKALFRPDTNCLILSKSAAAGRDLLKKIKDMYMFLPYHLKCGTLKWNQTSISFDNNSTISTEAFSPTAGLGQTINMLVLDEFAWCPPNEVELFYNNIIPTVTTISDSTVCIMSTQNGFNLFYKIWKSAIENKSLYAPFKTDWYQVPQYNTETKKWEKRTEKWHDMMVGILGSEEAFQYQYGTQFSASDACLASRQCLTKLRASAILYTQLKEISGYSLYIPDAEMFCMDPNYDINNFKSGNFCILCDLAEGAGNDSTAFNIFEINISETNKPTFTQVAYWKSNTIDLERAAVNFWMLCNSLFNNDNYIISIEWNTYGALFTNFLYNLNEPDMYTTYLYRFNISDELETENICLYAKGKVEDLMASKLSKNSKFIPGIRWSGESKKTACALTKMMLENDEIRINDIVQIGELENFEDTGSGSYAASYGHDDLMMTVVQIPLMMQTVRFKNFIEEITEKQMKNKYTYNNINTEDTMFSYNDIW